MRERPLRTPTSPPAICVVVVFVALALAGCGASSANNGETIANGPVHRHPDPSRWMKVDAAKHAVEITLVAAYDDSANGLNIDGSYKSALMFVVPVGWKARIRWVNDSEEDDYACVLTLSPGTHRHRGVEVDVLHPTEALAPGESMTFPFEPTGPALYRVIAVRGRPPKDTVLGMTVALKAASGGRPHGIWLR